MILKQFKIKILFLISLLVLSVNTSAQTDNIDKHINATLRKIGHEILLATGDSTSVVLPIVKNKLRYIIQFDTEFSFLPDSLAKLIDAIVLESKIATSYFIEIERFDSNQVIYSYEVGPFNPIDDIACKLRTQPKDRYSIHFTINDNEIIEVKSTNYLNHFMIGLGIFAILLLLYFYSPKKKNTITNNSSVQPSDLISIGNYFFDNTKMTLIYKDDYVELSSKETDLLFLLYSNKNTVVERDSILNQVWGDEGDYVGRTLDVFVSKLRKKLAEDSTIKIVNSRGVGYKLIV